MLSNKDFTIKKSNTAIYGECGIFFKIISTVLIFLVILPIFITSAYAEEITDSYMIFSAYNEKAFINDTQKVITKPLVIFDKTYVNLLDFSDFLNIKTNYSEFGTIYIKHVSSEKVLSLKLINTYDELDESNKYFMYNGIAYVPLRDVINFAGYNIKWDFGILILSPTNKNHFYDKKLFGEISLKNSNSIVYDKYGYKPEYTVYPYLEYSYDFMMADSKRLQKMYPALIKTHSVGKSTEGRELLLIELGKGNKKIFVCGAHHAREYISATYLMYMVDRYAYMYAQGQNFPDYDIKEILDNVTFCILPMVNPDGVNLVQNGVESVQNYDYVSKLPITESSQYGYKAWKANVNGVDINWNYDFNWNEIKNKNDRASSGFNGDYPNSEPEVKAICAYLGKNTFEAFLSFHTQGQIFYWKDDINRKTGIDSIVASDTGFTRSYDDANYKYGGSFFDYVYGKFGKPTMTVELSRYVGNYPYPNEDFDNVWNPAKHIALIFGREIMKQ